MKVLNLRKPSKTFFLYILILLFTISIVISKSPCPVKDSQIKSLSGFKDSDLPCMYSGFIPVEEDSKSQIFFWLILSDDWEKTPLITWLNGGPGSSSLFGLFTEMGPLRRNQKGEFIVEKTITWTSKASVLYVDQPVGTGYSFTSDFNLIPKNEKTIATHFYRFIQKFFISFNELLDKNFYLIGESYAGKYIPNMAITILEENKKIANGESHNQKVNLKKLVIGNGLFDAKYQRGARKDLAKGVNIMSEFDDEPQYDTLVKNCEFSVSLNQTDSLTKCDQIMDYLMDLAGDVYKYDVRKSSDVDDELLKTLDSYLNKDEVVQQIHVKNKTIKFNPYWSMGNDTVKLAMKDDINLISSIPVMESLLNNYDIPIYLYAGQFDLVDGPQGIERAIHSMNYKDAENFKKAPRDLWKIKTPNNDYIIAGYVKQFNNLIFITMRNSGHFAPRDRPLTSLNLLDHLFTEEKTWNCPDDKCSLVDKKCKAMKNCSGNGYCNLLTGGKCFCTNGFYGPDCSIKPEMLLNKKISKISPRDTKMFNLSHYETDVLLEIDSDDHNVVLSLLHKDDHEYVFNLKEHAITYKLVNHKLVLFVEKERFHDYLVVATNMEFIDEIELKIFVNSYSK
jgi:carboxypeptidase C (cathepsin A)